MLKYKRTFDVLMWVKSSPNAEEEILLRRAQKYIQELQNIPGIQMVAVVNSLSMYATHKDSDIDIFIITEERMLWLVRVMVTFKFYCLGVWRHGRDIRGNFCLSFFIDTRSMDLKSIAIQNDVYLFYWIYYMKPIIVRNNCYEDFLAKNTWVKLDEEQKKENRKYIIKEEQKVYQRYWRIVDTILRGLLEWKTRRNNKQIWNPEGIIIADSMLKFHKEDRRKIIRDKIWILEKNFDK
jgi:hypothetical protein